MLGSSQPCSKALERLGSRLSPCFKFAPQASPLPSSFHGALILFAALAFARVTLRRELPSFCLLLVTIASSCRRMNLALSGYLTCRWQLKIHYSKGTVHHRWLHGIFNVSFLCKVKFLGKTKGWDVVF